MQSVRLLSGLLKTSASKYVQSLCLSKQIHASSFRLAKLYVDKENQVRFFNILKT